MTGNPYLIHWLLAERTPASHREAGIFLSPEEQQKLATLRFPKRRDEWLAGRWAAKSLVRSLPEWGDIPFAQIEIGNNPEGAPFVRLPEGRTPPGCLSISHSGPFAFCALAAESGFRFGVDLEKVEPRSGSFVRDFFTPEEQRLVDAVPVGEQEIAVTLIWSLKESMLKALGMGLRLDTRQVEVLTVGELVPGDWREVRVGEPGTKNRPWSAWWQRRGDYLLTVAGFPEPSGPVSVDLIERQV